MTKRTQSKPSKANADPCWRVRNAEMCGDCVVVGDETKPTIRQIQRFPSLATLFTAFALNAASSGAGENAFRSLPCRGKRDGL